MEIKIELTKNAKEKVDPSTIGFGTHFTDHMFIMDYNKKEGWHNARIIPFGNLSLNPAAAVFHYGAEVFEGLKAYRTPNGEVQLFRPDCNIDRLNDSAERITLPQLDKKEALEALEKFVSIEKDWVPEKYGTSLYIRPFLIATAPELGLHDIDDSQFIIIASPVGNYYKEGINPVSIMIESEDVRAVRGGTGYAKCGGNYAASNRAAARAEQKGYSQVLWLDGVERKYIEEVGSMNIMFKINGKIVTPKLTGSVLPGITRRSCIQLLKDWGYEVEERLVSVDEIGKAAQDGTLEEVWGTGTAAVVSPVGKLQYKDKDYIINNFKIGEVTKRLFDELTGIQWGLKEDKYGWCVKIK